MWRNPLNMVIVPTSDSESFKTMKSNTTGLPLKGHPGSFGHVRKNHVHEGVDLYCPTGTPVSAVEAGEVVAVMPFTGEWAESPWWHNTAAVLVEGDTGVVLYGEIETTLTVGTHVAPGDLIGHVKQVLITDKGRPMSMLHLELHQHGTRDAYEWRVGETKPSSLLDPTPHFLLPMSYAHVS